MLKQCAKISTWNLQKRYSPRLIFFLHLFNHANSENIASIKPIRIREIPGKTDEGRPCAWYSGYDNACVPSPVSVAHSFLPVAEDITTPPPPPAQCSCVKYLKHESFWNSSDWRTKIHRDPIKMHLLCLGLYFRNLRIKLKNYLIITISRV